MAAIVQLILLLLATAAHASADEQHPLAQSVALTMPSHGAAAPGVSLQSESECQDMSDTDFLPLVKALGLQADVETSLKSCTDLYSLDLCGITLAQRACPKSCDACKAISTVRGIGSGPMTVRGGGRRLKGHGHNPHGHNPHVLEQCLEPSLVSTRLPWVRPRCC